MGVRSGSNRDSTETIVELAVAFALTEPVIDSSPIGASRRSETDETFAAVRERNRRVRDYNFHALHVELGAGAGAKITFAASATWSERDALGVVFHLPEGTSEGHALDEIGRFAARFETPWLEQRTPHVWNLHGDVLRALVRALAGFTWLERGMIVLPEYEPQPAVASKCFGDGPTVSFTVLERLGGEGLLDGFVIAGLLLGFPSAQLFQRRRDDRFATWVEPATASTPGLVLGYPDLREVLALVYLGYLVETERPMERPYPGLATVRAFEPTEKAARFKQVRQGRPVRGDETAFVVTVWDGRTVDVSLYFGTHPPAPETALGRSLRESEHVEVSDGCDPKCIEMETVLISGAPAAEP